MSKPRTNSDSKSSGSDVKISEGEKVLCYHGSLIYEAKCLKVRESEDKAGKLEYFIHYAGWSKKWEEWVGENRVLKYTEENIKKQQSLKEAKGNKAGKKTSTGGVVTPRRKSSTNEKDKDSGSSRPCSPAVSIKSNKSNQDSAADQELPEPSKKKRSIAPVAKEKEKEKEELPVKESPKPVAKEEKEKEEVVPVIKYRLKLKMPEQLIRCLANDSHYIQKQQFLTTVPAEISIKQMFDDFLRHKGPEDQLENQYCGLKEFVFGLEQYVDEMLGVQLLYRFEKPQYRTIKEKYPSTPLHELYGPVHIVRLLTRVELAFNTLLLTAKRFKLIEIYLHEFLRFLISNYDKYFNKDLYDAASPEYLRMTYK